MKSHREKEERLSAYIDALNEKRAMEPASDPLDDDFRDLMDTTHRIRALKGVDMPAPGFEERVADKISRSQRIKLAREGEGEPYLGRSKRRRLLLASFAVLFLLIAAGVGFLFGC